MYAKLVSISVESAYGKHFMSRDSHKDIYVYGGSVINRDICLWR